MRNINTRQISELEIDRWLSEKSHLELEALFAVLLGEPRILEALETLEAMTRPSLQRPNHPAEV